MAQPGLLPQVVSEETKQLLLHLRRLRLDASPGATLVEPSHETAIGEQLHDALAGVKILTSQVAMHLDRAWRSKLFQQLDALHDASEWEPGDVPVSVASYATFLRTIIALKPARRPGLGLTSAGNLIAAWTTGQDRLTFEFLPGGGVRWLLSCYDDERAERAAGESTVGRLPAVLAPYVPGRWFEEYANQSAT